MYNKVESCCFSKPIFSKEIKYFSSKNIRESTLKKTGLFVERKTVFEIF